LSGSLFFAMEETKLYRNIGLITSLIGLVLSFIFLYYLELGAVGFAWKMVIVQVISVNIQLYYNMKFLNLKMSEFVLHQLLSVLFFILLAFASSSAVYMTSNAIFNFLLTGTLYTFLVVIGTILFPYVFSTTHKEIQTFLKTKFLKRGL